MPDVPARRGNALAVVALICGCLFFLPFVPFVGIVLGIIALVRADPARRTLPLVAIAVSAGVFLVIQLTLAAVAIPSFIKYMRRARAAEARMQLGSLSTQVRMYLVEHGDGAPLPASDWTPAGAPCEGGRERFLPDAAAWSRPPWSDLRFSISHPHHYQYRVIRDGDAYLLEARGDLDCDGDYSKMSRRITADGSAEPLTVENELE